ncbi:MAG: phosphoglycerate kinase [bacterium]|nr:phosphoglycerate kinase [bacterium]
MKTITKEISQNKKVIVRLDLDVPFDDQGNISDLTRLESALPTLELLNESASQIIIIGHLGRPKGKVDSTFTLKPVSEKLAELLGQSIEFIETGSPRAKISMLENLRFDPREEANDENYAKELSSLGEVFVFEAFAVSHRAATSTVAITKLLPSFAGLRVAEEVETLTATLKNPEHPFLVILGGAKIETKLPMIQNMEPTADNIFVGGKLPYEINQQGLTFSNKVTVAKMNETGFDISLEAALQAVELINKAKLIVWNGPLGKFEDEDQRKGTKIIAEAVANSSAKKITGGGDTIAAMELFGIKDKIDFISVGGGAMLEFLSGKALPALKALEDI